MNRREASKKETRRLILKAARTLFTEKGMEDCTMRDIAKKAGVSPASVVVHFSNKTALLEEALYGDIEKAISGLMATLPDPPDLVGCFMHISRGMFRFYDANRALYRSLIRLTILETVGDTPKMARQAEEYLSFLAGLVDGDKARGVLRDDVDSTMAAASLFSFYLGALITFFRTPDLTPDMVAGILATMTEQYLEGIIRRHP